MQKLNIKIMNRLNIVRSLLIIFLFVLTIFGGMSVFGKDMNSGQNKKIEKERNSPNVVIIILDDMKDWVGYLGGYEGEVFTPNIDRLAAEGMAFTNAHVVSPQCNPSRNAFFLGKRPSTTGLYGNNSWWKTEYPDLKTMPQYFKDNGYITYGAGKVFHHTPGNNPPVSWTDFQDQVFDDPWNFATWSPEKYFLKYGYRGPILPLPSWKPLNGVDNLPTQMDWGAIPGKKEHEYGDVQVVDYARQFFQDKHEKPFFLALGIFKPHIPWHVPQKYFDMYPLDKVQLPKTLNNDTNDLPQEGKKVAEKHSNDFHTIKNAGKWKNAVQAYLASISFADAQVGNIMDALKKSKFDKNTIVLLWSDHGWHLGSKQTWHKFTLWEEVTRIPFIIKAPGITRAGDQCDQPLDMLNVYPTLLSLCNLPPKDDLEGHDMSILLKDPDADWKWPAITEYEQGQIAVRMQNWRYIRYSDGSEELYDRIADPYEWHNLANDKKFDHLLENNRKWIPDSFAKPASNKNDWYFDPYAYTYMNKETGEFIDGKK